MRFLGRQSSVAVTELSKMLMCEQLLVLEHQLGKRMTKEQQRRAAIGSRGHVRQDRAARHYSAFHTWWTAVRLALPVGTLLTLLGIAARTFPGASPAGWESVHRAVTTFAAPGAWWLQWVSASTSEGSWTLAIAGFAVIQLGFYLVISFVLLSFLGQARRAVSGSLA